MSTWIPGRCKACRAQVYWHKDFGWCDKPGGAKHVCPKAAA